MKTKCDICEKEGTNMKSMKTGVYTDYICFECRLNWEYKKH